MSKMTKSQRRDLYLRAAQRAKNGCWNACYDLPEHPVYSELPELALITDGEWTYTEPLDVQIMLLILAATI